MRTATSTFIRNWIVTWRAYPWSFFVNNLLSGIVTVLFAYFTYHFLAAGQLGPEFAAYAGTADYMSFIILGAAVYLFTVRILLGLSRSLIIERREGTLESLLLTPFRRLPYFLGVTAQWAVSCAGETAVILLIAWPLGLNLENVNLLTLLLVLPTTLLSLLGMGILLGGIMLGTGDTYISQNTLFVAISLVCGFFFPRGYLPLPLQWIGEIIPITGALQLLRAAVLQGAVLTDLVRLLISSTLIALAYVSVGLILVKWAERRALESAI